MTTEIDLFLILAGVEALLTMGLLAAMLYFAFACVRCRSGWWPRVFGGAVLSQLVVFGIAMLAAGAVWWSFWGPNPSFFSRLPVAAETWILLDGGLWLLSGLLDLVVGLALIFGGWRERGR